MWLRQVVLRTILLRMMALTEENQWEAASWTVVAMGHYFCRESEGHGRKVVQRSFIFALCYVFEALVDQPLLIVS